MTTDFELPTDIIGRWWFDHESDESPGILILDATGRAVQFYSAGRKPERDEVMRLWWTVEDPITLRFRPSPTSPGWIRHVRRTDRGFEIATDDRSFPVRAADEHDLPEWLESLYQKAIAMMHETEQSIRNQIGEPAGDGKPDPVVS